jgi:hypothetical protein
MSFFTWETDDVTSGNAMIGNKQTFEFFWGNLIALVLDVSLN